MHKRMNSVVMFGLVLTTAAALSLLPRPTSVTADGDHHDALHDAMEQMNTLFRQCRRQVRDETKNADTADKLHQLATLTLGAKLEMPEILEDVPASQRPAMQTTFRLTMNELITALLAAETALLNDDNDAAREALATANDIKGRGHELFIPEDE